jgi:hypothetical protein
MGEANCEKGESYNIFHMATPCTTCNLLSLQNQLNASKPHWDTICNQFLNDRVIVESETYCSTNY